MKAVRAADRLPTVSVESLMPEATSVGLNPTPITMISLLSALKGIIAVKKMFVQCSVIEEKIVISQTKTVTTCESDVVIDKVKELAIAADDDNKVSVPVPDKFQPTDELVNEVPVIATIAPDCPTIEKCVSVDQKIIKHTDDIQEIIGGINMYETESRDIAVDTQGDLIPQFDLTSYNEVHSFVQMMRFTSQKCN